MITRFVVLHNTGMIDYGGPGSGNFGHAGRAGKTGGSAPKSGAGIPESRSGAGISESRSGDGKSSTSTRRTSSAGTEGGEERWNEVSDVSPALLKKAADQMKDIIPGFKKFEVDSVQGALGVDNLNHFGKTIHDLHSRFPGIAERMGKSGRPFLEEVQIRPMVQYPGVKSGTLGCFQVREGRIQIATSISLYDGEIKPSHTEKISFGKYHPVQGAGATMRHEIGHAMLNSIPPSASSKWNKLMGKIGITEIGRSISVYGKTNSEEAFAESFSAYTSRAYKTSKQKLPKEVDSYFKELVGEEK